MNIKTYLVLSLPALVFSFLLISCGADSFTQQKSLEKGQQTLTFTETKEGIESYYEVHFNDGKITSVYKDNTKIREDEIETYKDLIYRKLNSAAENEKDFSPYKSYVFHFDKKKFSENMDKLKESFKGDHFKFKFDNEKFKEDMKRLKEELKSKEDIIIKIDSDKIRKHLDEKMHQLGELKIHKFNFDFDEDELNKNLKRITIELKDAEKEIELNMKKLEKEMEKLDEEMSELSKELKELDKEMKVLDNFLKAVKNEMVNDGFINNTDEEFELELTSEKMKVNGEKVSEHLYKKYKDIYKEHFNKEIKDKVKFHIK